MKRFVLTAFSIAILMLSLTALAAASDHDVCTNDMALGPWGYTLTGTLITPSGAVPFATVGTLVFEADGSISGTQTGSVGGQISRETISGTWDPINADCTLTYSVGIYSQSGQLLRTVNWAGVLVDNGTEARAIITSLVLPTGTNVPAIVTGNAKKSFSAPGNSK